MDINLRHFVIDHYAAKDGKALGTLMDAVFDLCRGLDPKTPIKKVMDYEIKKEYKEYAAAHPSN